MGIQVSGAQERRLLRFASLLRERAVPAGLVAPGDADRIIARHILDSMRAILATEAGDRDAYDLGSGAGLPGLVVAIVRPWIRVRLVDSRRRRVAFLELAVEDLAVSNAIVTATRVEKLREPADLCFARAFAPVRATWRVASPLLRPGGRLVYFAGRGFEVRSEVPSGVATRVLRAPMLERAGPLVIMAQQ